VSNRDSNERRSSRFTGTFSSYLAATAFLLADFLRVGAALFAFKQKMSRTLRFTLLIVFAASLQSPAQTPGSHPPDTLVLNDDEKLIGHFVRASGSSVVFKSDLLGQVTLSWSNIKELRSTSRYAVVEKHVTLNHRAEAAGVPKGQLDMSDQRITLHSETGSVRTIPVGDTAHVIEADVFERDVERSPKFTKGWNGTVTASAGLVEATQNSRAFTGAVHIQRDAPVETWLPPHDRTIFDFSAATGSVSQPATPTVKTEIWHAGAERDQYLSVHRVYAFGVALFDHNYSQGLDLMQNYGPGIGWTAIDRPSLTFDLKASVNYVHQQFQVPSENHSLVGSTFTESVTKKFRRDMAFVEQGSITPTWNELHASLASAGASFVAPVYKRLAFNIAFQDNFLNSPPPGFKKNSFQASTGLTYSLK